MSRINEHPLRVVVVSPYAGDVGTHLAYLRDASLDCLRRGEAPFAGHGFYTTVLDDSDPESRELGIRAGQAWARASQRTVVYTDLGITAGMRLDISSAIIEGVAPIDIRSLNSWRPRFHTTEHEQAIEAVVKKAAAVREIESMAATINYYSRTVRRDHVIEQIQERAARPDLLSPDEAAALLKRVLKK